ncbi:bifunctional 4-hydroxy-2-oxoglutarate aldolase/2-dehydro-3-deoxy-phosphogluconate aldolase [Novosphingobium pentaromativorans]|uniref:2-dehydro-3-deoxy-phosphogluconate aldolase n=1 Tax=Novosphingobium pentaromativorans US6-1 TaxID=1088721 RepID=G6EA31_9SPHN|nr:bifunctional 4-hydroxy-2-oxoglutarate aldolase/2-dehydro-3-deoxy-phosphogluconate aldolase [Novosphingobium pentaromativorans]AIT80826.1 2-dehydro-3-deoxyphosphogluconate aldolase [Novosphingobium pentaromativorans US6-1]EHJ61888.1 2-dehydro-3-deoxyphosphogluconate aldolase / 4-hydroxy-2-oxoglutarate aldolase [Novosphingobium pentaromativorans US6-1]
MSNLSASVEKVMRLAPVIPVLVIEDIEHALPVAEALVAGGLPALEVTLRTDCAIEAIKVMKQVPGAVVGAGTVLNPDDLDRALDAGAEFIVSPGLTPRLGEAAIKREVPFLPGTANASDVMLALDMGFDRLKFFPAMAAGGPPALKAISAPLAQAKFCPTGGVTPANAPEWLALDAVICVGGSWMVPKGKPDPKKIEADARTAAGLAR